MIARQYRISGRVQGVGFRWFVKNAAGEEVRGTVRNAEDGSVEIFAWGEAEQLDDFAARIRNGPPTADVRGVEEIPLKANEQPPADFRIIR